MKEAEQEAEQEEQHQTDHPSHPRLGLYPGQEAEQEERLYPGQEAEQEETQHRVVAEPRSPWLLHLKPLVPLHVQVDVQGDKLLEEQLQQQEAEDQEAEDQEAEDQEAEDPEAEDPEAEGQ